LANIKYHLPKDYIFGVELEFSQARLEHDYDKWQVAIDDSVTEENDVGEDIGGELISPRLDVSAASFRDIARMIKLLTKYDAGYGDNTGYHIHMDLDGIDRLVYLALWLQLSNDVYRIFPNRRNKLYCQPLIRPSGPYGRNQIPIASQVSAMLLSNTTLTDEKYNDVHLYTRDEYHMVEVRVGEMSDDYDFITGWTKICLQIVNEAAQYFDFVEFLEESERLSTVTSILDMNNRAPRKLQLTEREHAALDNQCCF